MHKINDVVFIKKRIFKKAYTKLGWDRKELNNYCKKYSGKYIVYNLSSFSYYYELIPANVGFGYICKSHEFTRRLKRED